MEDELCPTVGMSFDSFDELEQFMQNYCDKIKVKFVRKNSSAKINESSMCGKKNNKVKPNINLKYTNYTYKCKFGEERPSESSGQRRTSTYSHGCLAFITLNLSPDKQKLQIFDLNLSHSNHPLDAEKNYQAVPEVRRLPPELKKNVADLLKLGSNNKLVKNFITNVHNKPLFYKDIANIKAQTQVTDGNNFQKFCDILLNKHKCSVDIKTTGNKFEAIFFYTPRMQKALTLWPEIVFVDGTYKLTNLDYPLILFQVLNSTGRTEIIGAALVYSENYDTLKWLAESVKKMSGSVWKRIKCFMGDKDMTARKALKDVFPDACLYLCIFQTLKAFSRNIRQQQLSKPIKVKCIETFEKLVYSESENDYVCWYNELKKIAPSNIWNYFSTHWHPLKTEWTKFHMTAGNFNQHTNNMMENTNKQIKTVCEKNSTFCRFGDSFFEYYQSQTQETDLKRAHESLRKPKFLNHVYTNTDNCVQKYNSYLTLYAFRFVFEEIKAYSKVPVSGFDFKLRHQIIITTKTTIEFSTTNCTCHFYSTMRLPCRHIFSIRHYLAMPLFSTDLCDQRWTKVYDSNCVSIINNDEASNYQQENTRIDNQSETREKLIIEETSTSNNISTYHHRRKIIEPYAKDLINTGSLVTGEEFEYRRETIRLLSIAWRQNLNVRIIVEPIENDATSEIAVASPIKIKGRPKGCLETTTGYFPRKQ